MTRLSHELEVQADLQESLETAQERIADLKEELEKSQRENATLKSMIRELRKLLSANQRRYCVLPTIDDQEE